MRGWIHYRDRFDTAPLPTFAARHWGAESASLELVERKLSIIVRLRRAGETHYLRISHPSIRQPRTARAAYHFQAQLAARGAPVCAPVLSVGGNHIEWLPQGNTRYFAGLVKEAPGEAIAPDERDPRVLRPRSAGTRVLRPRSAGTRVLRPRSAGTRVFRAWGRSIAQLHEAARAYRAGPHRHHTIFDFYQNARPQALRADPAIRAAYFRLGRWLSDLPRRDFALTHGDMHPANAFWDGRRVTIIDFDEPVYNWIWVDFGRALLDFYRRPPRARRQLHDALLAGYGEIRAIDAELHGQLPRFMQLRGLMMHLWSLADEGGCASGPAPHQRVWALREQGW